MTLLDGNEAVLFRLLVAFFGEDRVIPHMSLHAVCGGGLPADLSADIRGEIEKLSSRKATEWARGSKCLFTIVDQQDSPRLVMEFFQNFDRVIDLTDLHRRRMMPAVLSAARILYVTISADELGDIMDPGLDYGLADFLQTHLDLTESASAGD